MTLFWLGMGLIVGCLWTALSYHLGWCKGFTEADEIRTAHGLELWKTEGLQTKSGRADGVDRSDA
jgi:hypothetical protein